MMDQPILASTSTPNPQRIGSNVPPERQDRSVVIPTKHTGTTPLPPVSPEANESLVVTKKRKLQLVAEPDDPVEKARLIPTKSASRSASLSTTSKSSTRVPSLNDTFRPELSPPTSNQSYRSFEESPDIIRTTSTPVLDNRVFSSPSKIPSQSTPKTADLKSLKRKETDLDARIRRENAKLETLKRAKTILLKNDSESNAKLVDKWRDAAQKASNFLLSAAVDKVNKVGGKREFVRREREKFRDTIEYSIDSSFQDRIGEVTQSEAYEQLPEDEQERVIQRLEEEQDAAMKEAGKSMMQNDGDDDACDNDFTMKDLYKRLNMDYKLVYPESRGQ